MKGTTLMILSHGRAKMTNTSQTSERGVGFRVRCHEAFVFVFVFVFVFRFSFFA